MALHSYTTLKLRRCFFLIAFATGLIHAWFTRNVVDSDGIIYLDMGDAYLRDDFKSAINASVSPLYSWILGLCLHTFKVAPDLENTFVHFVNFFIFLFTFFCFDFFLRQLIQNNKKKEAELSKNQLTTIPEPALLTLGYVLFIWTSMNLITISHVNADMCLSATVYLASGILLKVKSGITNLPTFILFGITLGFGYLSKTIMFFIAFVFFILIIFAAWNLRLTLSHLLIALIVFLFIASPFIYSLSKMKGYFTFGETGKLNYVLNVIDAPCFCTKDFPDCKNLIHPVRIIFNEPMVLEYNRPINVTHPFCYDRTYWYDGFKIKFDLKKQIKVLLSSAYRYFTLFFHLQGIIFFSYLTLLFSSKRIRFYLKDVSEQWNVLVPTLIAFILYSLVDIQYRYIGAFVLIMWLGLFSALKLPDSKEVKNFTAYLVLALAILMIVTSIFSKDLLGGYQNTSACLDWKVAEGLKKIGIREKDKVSCVGAADDVYWARLAKVHIIAEVLSGEENKFWFSDKLIKLQVLRAFKNAGAKVVVATNMPSNSTTSGWKNIQGTPYYFYVL